MIQEFYNKGYTGDQQAEHVFFLFSTPTTITTFILLII